MSQLESPSPNKPRCIVIAGPNGSGKTSVTHKILKHEWLEQCTYINPDFIAKDEFGDWNSPTAILNAADKAKTIREECLQAKESFVFESVFSSQEKLSFLKKAKESGFFIRFFFVNTNSPTINAYRVAKRVLEGGHDVPIPKIISRYLKSISNGLQAAKFVDRAYFYDNSIDYADPRLLFRTIDGRLEKVYPPIAPWAEIVYENLAI